MHDRFRLSLAAAVMGALLLGGCGGGEAGDTTGSDQVALPEQDAAPRIEGDALIGAFGPPGDWPLVPIHMGLLPDGRLLTFGRESPLAAQMIYDIWDYRAGLSAESHLTLPNQTGTDLFCANQLLLSGGEMLMTGGDTREGSTDASIGYQTGAGNADANVFDPQSNRLSRSGTMNEPRWYGTMTKLPGGEVFIQGGSTQTLAERPRHVEIASPDGKVFRLLQGFEVHDLPWLYPRNFVDSSGQITGWAKRHAYRLNPREDGSRTDFGLAPQVRLEDGALAVMYRPGQVLLAGGRSPRAVRVQINSAIPVYEAVPEMSSPRIWGSATVLPNGDVLATNGGSNDSSVVGADLGVPALHVSIYNPESNTWQRGPSAKYPRLYHSASILLPDATVLLGGGGLPGPVTNLNAEIYYPPYLFTADGRFAPRPEVVSAPTVVNPATGFELTASTESQIERIVLVKTGAVTHSFDMDQRFVELSFSGVGDRFTAQLPVHPADTPPGFYHLFVLDAAGVPSVSHILRINAFSGEIPELPKPGPLTQTLDGSWPREQRALFDLSCAEQEVLVGLHGEIDGNLAAVGPVCAASAAEPILRPAAGRMMQQSASGGFVSMCPAGQAVSALRGRSDQTVIGFELLCRSLDDAGNLAGEYSAVAPVGQINQTRLGPCPDNAPAVGIRGETETRFDQVVRLGLRCAA